MESSQNPQDQDGKSQTSLDQLNQEISSQTLVKEILSDVTTEAHKEAEHHEKEIEVKELLSDMMLDVKEEAEQREREMKWPSLAVDKLRAKAFLQRVSPTEGISLYEHLTAVINKVLAEKPKDVLEYFEEYSRSVKQERFLPGGDYLRDIFIPPEQIAHAKQLQQMFKSLMPKEEYGEQGDVIKMEEAEAIGSDLLKQHHYFEQAGIALPRTEMLLIQMAMRKLVQKEQTIRNYRFWGKIFGLQKNYIIVEALLKEEEYTRRIQELEEKKEWKAIEDEMQAKISAAETEPVPPPSPEPQVSADVDETEPAPVPRKELPPLPQPIFEPPPEVPPENSGEGVNRKVYFVCNTPGDKWTMLADVTPQQIAVARKIRRYFTGNLDTKVETFPPFPGNEGNYLRAQIARISASTQVSPVGYYSSGRAGEEEGEEEEGEAEAEGLTEKELKENQLYEPPPLKDLADGSLAFWVHHTPHILKQGRTVWWNPKSKPGTKAEERGEEEEGEVEEEEIVEAEMGPALFTPLSEDVTADNLPPWIARLTSQFVPEFAAAFLRSNLWPGACAIAAEKVVENLYLGWGHKFITTNYTPPVTDPIQSEYPVGPEIMEMQDPTTEEEEAWRVAHEPKLPAEEKGEEEKGEGEGEETEEEQTEEEQTEEEEEEEED